MKGTRWVLAPIALLWAAIIKIRTWAFQRGILRRVQFDIPTVVVGNLQAGGSGKTPAIELLLELFSSKYKVATLSRGYGRNTTGFRIASDEDTAQTIGDEPLQLYTKWKDKAIISVGEQRILAIPSLLLEYPETEAIFLDDAYQHLPLLADKYVLLSSFSRPFFNDFVLPMGYLREPRKGAGRADMVVFTKCAPHLDKETQTHYTQQAKAYLNTECPVLFSTIEYSDLIPKTSFSISSNYLLVSGIANSQEFYEAMHKKGKVLHHLEFRDHYAYKMSDVEHIISLAKTLGSPREVTIVTTEKDYVKLNDSKFKAAFEEYLLHYLPIKMAFLEENEAQIFYSDIDRCLNKFISLNDSQNK